MAKPPTASAVMTRRPWLLAVAVLTRISEPILDPSAAKTYAISA